MKRKPKTPRRTTKRWYVRLKMKAEAMYFPVSEEPGGSALDLWPWAGLLTLVGTPDDSDAVDVYREISKLLFGRGRSRQWADAAAVVPAMREAVVGLANVIREYERVAGHGDLVRLKRVKKLRMVQVVEGMLLVSTGARDYVEAAERIWCQHPNAVFSEPVREQLAKKLRGLLGRYSDLDDDDDLSHIPRV